MLSLILPTYNEAQNLPSLIDHLDGVLRTLPHEIIVVDDNSPDGTWRVAQNLATRYPAVRVIRRVGKKGLSSAVVDGFDAAHGDTIVVMDADGQHDSALLGKIVTVIDQGADIVIGSRYVPGGSVGEWVTDRRIISRLGTFFAQRVSNVRVSDPLGGFFAIRVHALRTIRSSIHPTGFKILLEILAHVPSSTRVVEVPLVFRPRLHGESKLTFSVHVAFCIQVLRLATVRLFRMLRRSGVALLAVVTLLFLLVLAPRAWSLRRLYTDSSLRALVRSSLQDTADREGWLLSDITLRSVTPETATFIHRFHLRRAAPAQRCSLVLRTRVLTCTDA